MPAFGDYVETRDRPEWGASPTGLTSVGEGRHLRFQWPLTKRGRRRCLRLTLAYNIRAYLDVA